MDDILHDLRDYYGIFVDVKGHAGRQACLWDKKVTINLLSCSLHHVVAFVTLERNDLLGNFLTFTYGSRLNTNG